MKTKFGKPQLLEPHKKEQFFVCNMLSNICNKILIKKTYSERAYKSLWSYCGTMLKNRKKLDTHIKKKEDVESYEEDTVVKMEELIVKHDMEYKLTMRE